MTVASTLRRALVIAIATAVPVLPALAQSKFPDKPIRIVVPFAAGSGTDVSTRYFSQQVATRTGWNFVVDNKAGANGFIGLEDVLRAPADGYTLVYTGGTTHGVNSALFKKLPYDPVADFIPIAPGLFSPMVLLASPKLKVTNAAELLAYIKANPGKASFAPGSSFQQLAGELFAQQAGLQVNQVPYKGSSQAITDLLGGHVDFAIVDLSAAMPHIRAGTIKGLAVMSDKRVPPLPDVPTMGEAGLPAIQLDGWAGLFVKKGTPALVVAELRRAFSDYFQSADYSRYLSSNGNYMKTMSPEQMQDFVASEIKRAKEVFARAGVQPN
jgi:tripartite-type tricarboxylate transporter receptor subunit TctC